MPYVDLIPSVMPISLASLANGATYRSEAFNVGDKMEIGIVIKADQALSVRVAYGASTDTAAIAGTGTSAALPFVTAATSFASSAGSAEAGTYHSIAIPPSARKAQLVISNSSGSTANSITIDAALRRQAYPSGGGGATTDAGDLTTGTLAAARLPGVLANVDTQAELLSAAAAAAASHTHAISDITSLQTSLDGKMSDTGDTISGDLLHSASIRIGPNTSDGSDNLTLTLGHSGNTRGGQIRIMGNESASAAGQVHFTMGNAVNSQIRFYASDGTTRLMYLSNTNSLTTIQYGLEMVGNIRFSGNISSVGASTRNIHGNDGATDLYANVPTGGVWGVSVNGTAQSTMGTGGLQFPTAHTAPATSVYGVWRDAVSTVVQGPTTGFAYLCANGSNPPTMGVSGTGSSSVQGSVWMYPAPLSLAAAGTRTVMTSATTHSGDVTVMNTTDGKRATYSVENGTPVKIEGDASFVAGAPGASQIGLELSSTTLRINNGYAGAKLIAFIARLA